jgi:hypothetical protein
MPILVMALLALIIFGTIGILLVVAVIMEHFPGEHPARRHGSHPVTSDVAPSLQNFDRARGGRESTENPSTEEKVHEHAYVG